MTLIFPCLFCLHSLIISYYFTALSATSAFIYASLIPQTQLFSPPSLFCALLVLVWWYPSNCSSLSLFFFSVLSLSYNIVNYQQSLLALSRIWPCNRVVVSLRVLMAVSLIWIHMYKAPKSSVLFYIITVLYLCNNFIFIMYHGKEGRPSRSRKQKRNILECHYNTLTSLVLGNVNLIHALDCFLMNKPKT